MKAYVLMITTMKKPPALLRIQSSSTKPSIWEDQTGIPIACGLGDQFRYQEKPKTCGLLMQTSLLGLVTGSWGSYAVRVHHTLILLWTTILPASCAASKASVENMVFSIRSRL